MARGLPRSLARSKKFNTASGVKGITALGGTLTGTVDGDLANIAATAAATAGASSPTAAQVDTGIATAVASIVTGTNTQLKELQTKVNAILAALQL